MDIAIIADDLTGACDSAVGFARAGHSAVVAFHPLRGGLPDADVVAIDAASRSLAAPVAAARVAAATTAVADARILVKKLDSTLRGQLAAEVDAALTTSGRRAALVAPAFPAYGRTTENGIQMLHGLPVHEGAAGRDPIVPARTSDLREIFGSAAPVIAEPAALSGALDTARIVIADARTDRDLDAIVAAAGDPAELLWCGSTGISHALGRAFPGTGQTAAAPAPARKVVVVVGSLNPVAREQLRRLDDHPDVAIVASNAAIPGNPHAVATALAAKAIALVDGGADGLVLTGGDTAVAVIRALGASGFTVLDEVETGIPSGILRGPRPLRVVTKAGGFGGPDALTAATRKLLVGA